MSTTDARGHTVPEGTDPAARQSLLDLSLSIPSIRACVSATAAAQYVQDLAAAGVPATPDKPALVLVDGIVQAWDGANWVQLTARPGQWTQFAGGCWARLNAVTRMVNLKGLVSDASLSEGSAIITGEFPKIFRPTQTVVMPAAGFSGGHYGYSCAIRVTHDGVFEAVNPYKMTLSYIYVGGLSYPID
mgnify:CR=1 FL=1